MMASAARNNLRACRQRSDPIEHLRFREANEAWRRIYLSDDGWAVFVLFSARDSPLESLTGVADELGLAVGQVQPIGALVRRSIR